MFRKLGITCVLISGLTFPGCGFVSNRAAPPSSLQANTNVTVVGVAADYEIWPALTQYLASNPQDSDTVNQVMNSANLQNEKVVLGTQKSNEARSRDAGAGAAPAAGDTYIFLGPPGWPITIQIGPGGNVTIGFGPPGWFNPILPPGPLPPIIPAPPLNPPGPPANPIVPPAPPANPPPPANNPCGANPGGTLPISPNGGPVGCICPGTGPTGAPIWNNNTGTPSCGNSPYNQCYGAGIKLSQCMACVNSTPSCGYTSLGYSSDCLTNSANCAANNMEVAPF